MALNNFIPQIWAGSILRNLNKALVYGQTGVVNRNYEGDIKDKGDRVKINNIGAVTVFDYTKNTDMPAPEVLTDAQQTLIIDQSKGFNFQIDDIDKAQQDPKVMGEATYEAGFALGNVTDQYIASLYVGVAGGNTIGSDASPIVLTNVTAYEYLVDLGVLLDNANIPQEGRWVVVPSAFVGRMLKDDRFVRAGTTRTDEVLKNGEVGEAAGFKIYKSNNVPNTGGIKYKVIAGYPGAISYAAQIMKMVPYRPEKRFADALKGLKVYGAKLVRPTGIAVLTCNP